MGAGPFLAVFGIIAGLPSAEVLEPAGLAFLESLELLLWELLVWLAASLWSAVPEFSARALKPAVRIEAQAALQPFWSDSMVALPTVTDLVVTLCTLLRASVTLLMQASPDMPSMVMVRVVGFVEVAEESAADDGAEVAAGLEGWEGLEVVEGVVDESMVEAFQIRAVADGLLWCSV